MAERARAAWESGYLASGLPYARLGNGARAVVVFHGLFPDNRPMTGRMGRALLAPFAFLARDRTVYVVNRRVGLPAGHTLEDMADDYAEAVRELGAPVDVIGMSTGGSIAQLFAVRHPDLVGRLVLYSTAHSLSPAGRLFQAHLADLARRRHWGAVSAETVAFMYLPRRGLARALTRPLVWLLRLALPLVGRGPGDPSDFLVTIAAEDAFDCRSLLGRIRAPTLVLAGTRDPFYPTALFRETAAGIPGARLVLIRGGGHGPSGRRVQREIAAFLDAERPPQV